MKKAQSQIITTILIILLVLAAIVIVWQVISRTVEKGSETLEEKATCLDIRLELKDVSCTGTAITGKISRGADSVGSAQMKVIVNDVVGTAEDAPVSLGTKDLSGTGVSGSNVVKVAAVLNNGALICDPVSEETVTCA